MRTLTVEVTQADIDAGEPCDPERCPVGLALSRATGRSWRVGLVLRPADLPMSKGLWVPEASRFARQVDLGRKAEVRPFSFTLEVPDEFA